jgi:CDP-paratose 2-epimerase
VSIAIVTGSAGLIGSEAVKLFASKGLSVIGIDNDMRSAFFGAEASTAWNLRALKQSIPDYTHYDIDIRDSEALSKLFKQHGNAISVVIHCAAQPSHDWAALDPHTDFTVNANGTLNLLELTRQHCIDAPFLFLSTNKVYGDTPNFLPLVETATRWEIDSDHPYHGVGIDEMMSIDHSKHSLFGVSKASADLLVQEYGRYFGLKTACFRGGCLTGPAHSGTRLHGFLSYLMRCTVSHQPYSIYGYKGKQVRDNIHSYDLVNALWHFYQAPQSAAVYNMGGGINNNCSVLEAIDLCQMISGETLSWTLVEDHRIGDHIWWVSDVRKFKRDYPEWDFQYNLSRTLTEIYEVCEENKAKQYDFA